VSLSRDQFETNVFAAINVVKAVLPVMREKKNGHIILLSTVAAHLGTPGLPLYCASLWAIEGYCDVR
jgi:NADP-dependent 3-hydroxy acid dehydrogenase YdfG